VTDDELIARWIEPNPHKGGKDEARLKRYAISVWAIAGELQAPGVGVAELARDFDVPGEAIEAAAAYYRQHKCLIDNRLRANAV